MTVAAYADLGGLGTKQGPPARFVWTLPNLLPVLLPWLVVLALLALPSNRSPRAWWIWAPLIGLALLATGLEAAFAASIIDYFVPVVQAAVTASFGLATIWLLGASLARRGRALGIVLLAAAGAAVSLLGLVVSPAWDEMRIEVDFASEEFLYLLLVAVLCGLVYAGALNLTGWMCRKRFGSVRVSLRLLFWLWAMWIVALGLLGGVMELVFGDSFPWVALLMGPIALGLVSFALILPFLILSFSSSFYRERLQRLLRLPAPASAPAMPAPAPIAAQGPPP